MGGKAESEQAVAQHVVVPAEDGHEAEVTSEPWYHPHHLMHHGGEIIAGASIIIVAILGYCGVRYRKSRASK